MRYVFNEGTVSLPDQPEDRSVNVLVLLDPEQDEPLTLVITRDEMEPGETLEGCVKRQMTILSRQLRGFVEIRREGASIGAARIPGVIVEAQNANDGSKVYQLLAIFPVASPRILVYALTSVKPFQEAQRLLWNNILASYTQAPQV